MSIMTKRYALFAGEAYYPSGGFHDYLASFDSIEDAKEDVPTLYARGGRGGIEWAHIADLLTGQIVAVRGSGHPIGGDYWDAGWISVPEGEAREFFDYDCP